MKFTVFCCFLCVSMLSMTVMAQRGSWFDRQARPRPPTNRRTTTSTAAPSAPGADDCPCVTLQQYNPVCGTDGVTYSNPQRLDCARSCGKDISLAFYGTCAVGR